MDVDWREHLRWVTRRRHARSTSSTSAPGRPSSSCTASPAAGRTGSRTSPRSRATIASIALDLPGFGASPMPADADHDAGLRAHARRAVRDARRRLRDARRQLDGRLRRRRVRDPLPARRSSACASTSPAGLSMEHMRNERNRGLRARIENYLFFGTYWAASKSDRVVRRERLRRALLLLLAAHPERLPSALIAEQAHGAGKPGFAEALDAMTGYPIRDRLGEIACPTLVVWGELDRLVPLRDAAEFEWLIPRRAQGRLRGHRPSRHARASRPLQRRPAGVPRGGRPQRARPGRACVRSRSDDARAGSSGRRSRCSRRSARPAAAGVGAGRARRDRDAGAAVRRRAHERGRRAAGAAGAEPRGRGLARRRARLRRGGLGHRGGRRQRAHRGRARVARPARDLRHRAVAGRDDALRRARPARSPRSTR